MESLEFNKVAGGVLGTLLFVVGLGIVTNGMFTPEKPKKPGWDLPSAPEGAAGGETKKEEKEESFTAVLAKADPAKGKSDTGVCGTCHNFGKGEGAKTGPDLYGVVGRPKGSVAGFNYSAGMKAKGGKWTFEDLNTFITKPAAYVDGTLMGYPGEADVKKRAEIIAYLNKNSDSPLPLPKPEAAPAKAEAKGGGAAGKSDKPEPSKSSEPTGGEKGAAKSGGEKTAAAGGGGDPAKGKADAATCGMCHNFGKGEGAKVGPPLYGVVGRPKGSVAGFSYSEAMKAKGGNWTPEDISTFITNPQEYVKGTIMGFQGEPDAKKRADIVAYLASNSDHPPAAKKAEAPAAAPPPKAAAAAPAKPAPAPAPAPAPKAAAAPPAQPAAPAQPAPAQTAAAGDAAKGKADTAACGVCHNFGKGEGAKVGPPLWGVVGRDKGSVAGFNYSPAMKAKGGKWTPEDISTFITNPQAYVKGTIMQFPGEPDAKKRADIVAFLSSLK